jgi:ketosteroid isomerase-like protein
MGADDVMQQYAAAWGRGDSEAAFTSFADGVVMRLPGRGALAGIYEGKSAVIAAIRGLLARTDGIPVTVEVLDRLVSDTSVALQLREVATRGDEVLDLRRVNVYGVRDGKIVAIDIYEADQYEVDEFFG